MMVGVQGPVFYIRPSRGWAFVRWGEIWEYRELLYFLVWRDVKVRYKQTFLGALWAVLQPALTMIIFTVFFGRIAGVASDGAPYPVFSYAAVLPWTMYSEALTRSAESLVGSANLVRKVYFPRLLVPASAVLGTLVDFVIAFGLLVVILGLYGIKPPLTVVALPILVLLMIAVALGSGIWLSALNARYRDVRYVVTFLVQLWMFVTPVIYPTSSVISRLARLGIPGWLYGLNPMVGVVEGFRWALLGSPVQMGPLLIVSAVMAAIILSTGLLYFRTTERALADIL
jgi:lipopolysaccharide transport system permease protein